MLIYVKKVGVLFIFSSVLVSCGLKKEKKDLSLPPEFTLGDKITSKLENGTEIISNLVGVCRMERENARKLLMGVYRNSLDPSVGKINLLELEIKQGSSGYSVSWTELDSAEDLKIEENAGILTVLTTEESKPLIINSKLDLNPPGTIIVKLNPFAAADGNVSKTPVTLKGYVEGMMECGAK